MLLIITLALVQYSLGLVKGFEGTNIYTAVELFLSKQTAKFSAYNYLSFSKSMYEDTISFSFSFSF